MATRFDDWEGDFLAHFGTKGMKWGTRKYQNEDGSLTELGRHHYGVGMERSARGVSRDLRRLEKERAGAQARKDYYEKKAARSNAKARMKSKKKGEPIELSKRVQKLNQKAKDYAALEKNAKSLSDRIISKALAKGYSIKSRDTMRFVRKGADKALMILGRKGTSVVSTKYHVKDNGLGMRTHKKTIGAINRARHRTNFI